MATQVQNRRGTTAEHSTFTGANGELTVDTDKDVVVVHDGSTAGGHPMLKQDGSNSALALGSAASPSLKWDANTGIYSPGADQVAISTNGQGRLFVDANGNVGVGGSPSVALDVFRTSDASVQLLRAGANNVANTSLARVNLSVTATGGISLLSEGFGTAAGADFLVFGTANNERMRLDSSGRLGLGSSAPSERFDLQLANGAGNLGIRLVHVGQVEYKIGINDSDDKLYITNNNGDAAIGSTTKGLVITPTGAVGIGSDAPTANLALSDSSNFPFIHWNNSSNTTIAFLGWHGGAGGGDDFRLGTVGTKAVTFQTNNTERARIDSSGRLLVGTSTSRQVTIGESAGWDPRVQVTKTGTDGGNIAAYSWSTYNTSTGGGQGIGPDIVLARSNSNTEGTHVALTSAQLLGRITFNGSNGSAFAAGAYIAATADDAWASGDHPTRLVFSTTADGASSPTERMRIQNDGNISVGSGAATTYRLGLAVASGADKDVFLAGISGASNGFQVNWIHASTALSVKFNNITTTASAANAFLDSADGNRIYRSTSSLRYKKDVEDLDQLKADAVFSLRPVWYRSKVESDRSDWSWYGLIAEEVAKVEPRLVHWTYLDDAFDIEEVNGKIEKTLKPDAELVPDGVQYDRLTVLLLDVVKRQQQAIETLEAKVAALEAQ